MNKNNNNNKYICNPRKNSKPKKANTRANCKAQNIILQKEKKRITTKKQNCCELTMTKKSNKKIRTFHEEIKIVLFVVCIALLVGVHVVCIVYTYIWLWMLMSAEKEFCICSCVLLKSCLVIPVGYWAFVAFKRIHGAHTHTYVRTYVYIQALSICSIFFFGY